MMWFGKAGLTFNQNADCLTHSSGEAFCFTLKLPAPIYRVSNFVNLLVPYDEKSSLCETEIWLKTWGVWNEVHEQTGMYILAQMRENHGERMPLAKPALVFGRLAAPSAMRIWFERGATPPLSDSPLRLLCRSACSPFCDLGRDQVPD